MKTLEELLKEVMADEKLKKEAVKAYKANKVDEFLKAHNCNATVDDAVAFVKAKAKEMGIPLDLLGSLL